jgi:hypothetical protein
MRRSITVRRWCGDELLSSDAHESRGRYYDASLPLCNIILQGPQINDQGKRKGLSWGGEFES